MIRFDKNRSSRRPLGFIVHDVGEGRVGALDRLAEFRQGLYGCFGSWADSKFELVDALAGAARPIGSIAELMFEPVSRRGWGSLYQSLEHGTVDAAAGRRLLAGLVSAGGGPMMFAIDESKYPRPETRVVADVGMQYDASREGSGSAPAVPGWSMQWVSQVGLGCFDGEKDSWSLPVDVRRVATTGNANDVAAEQIVEVTAEVRRVHPTAVPLFLLDSKYCPVFLTQKLPVCAQVLVRLRTDRVFFGRVTPQMLGRPGRQPKHGARFALDEPDTWESPDAEVHFTRGRTQIRARAWHGKHPEPRPRRKWEGTDIVEGTLIRREATFPNGSRQVWWLWWAGPAEAFDLKVLAEAYRHRYTIEHGFRFVKQDLFWTGHTPIDPAQAERWTWVVAFAYAQLHLARPLAADHRLPWEKAETPEQLSPRRVRRVFRLVTADLPSPARQPKPSRPGPGRPKGSKNLTVRPRHKVVKKGRPANTGHRKGHSPRATTTPTP